MRLMHFCRSLPVVPVQQDAALERDLGAPPLRPGPAGPGHELPNQGVRVAGARDVTSGRGLGLHVSPIEGRGEHVG